LRNGGIGLPLKNAKLSNTLEPGFGDNAHALLIGRNNSRPRFRIAPHMIRIGRRRDDARHNGMRHDVFQGKLRPAFAIQFLGNGWKRLSAEMADQRTFTQWPIDQNGDTQSLCGRQQALLRRAIHK